MKLTKEEHNIVDIAVQATLDYMKQHVQKDYQKFQDNLIHVKSLIKPAKDAAAERVYLSRKELTC